MTSQGLSTAALSSVALLGNQAAEYGGALILAGGSGSGLFISGGLIAGNDAGTGGGAVALHSPAFMLSATALADNSAVRGGGVHLATDFGASMSGCAAFPGCNAPLNALNFTGYVGEPLGVFSVPDKRSAATLRELGRPSTGAGHRARPRP